jgi:hypothetical protein
MRKTRKQFIGGLFMDSGGDRDGGYDASDVSVDFDGGYD